MFKKIILIAVFFLFLSMSLWIKIMSIGEFKETATQSDVAPIIATYTNKGFRAEAQENLLNNDFLVSTIFNHPLCPNNKFVLTPLHRNSENVPVVKDRFNAQYQTSYFLYNEKKYEHFPAFQFWFQKNFQSLLGLIKIPNSQSTHYVLFIHQKSPCGYLEYNI